MLSADRLRKHVIELADLHAVSLTWVTYWRQAESWPELSEAVVPEIRDARDYVVAMHELGHCLDPLARSWHDRTDPYGILVSEGAAWAWAAANALPGLELTDWDRAGRCFRSHLAHQAPA
jgi:hypothetical protein